MDDVSGAASAGLSAPLCSLIIEGEPVPWARARGGTAEYGGFYTPARQRSFKKIVRDYAWAFYRGSPLLKPIPVGLAVRVFLAVPASWSVADRKAALEGRLRPVAVPDLDQWIKLPMDALKGVIWQDDSQVVDFDGSGKWYAPRVRMEIEVRRRDVE